MFTARYHYDYPLCIPGGVFEMQTYVLFKKRGVEEGRETRLTQTSSGSLRPAARAVF